MTSGTRIFVYIYQDNRLKCFENKNLYIFPLHELTTILV